MNDELKPVRCGCGGTAKVVSYLGEKYSKMVYYVRCDKCGMASEKYRSEKEAIEAWNTAMGEKDND